MKSIRPINGRLKRHRTLAPELMLAYRQLTAAFTAELELDELQGAVEHLLDAVRVEVARTRTHRRQLGEAP